jgi:hypothetical protein
VDVSWIFRSIPQMRRLTLSCGNHEASFRPGGVYAKKEIDNEEGIRNLLRGEWYFVLYLSELLILKFDMIEFVTLGREPDPLSPLFDQILSLYPLNPTSENPWIERQSLILSDLMNHGPRRMFMSKMDNVWGWIGGRDNATEDEMLLGTDLGSEWRDGMLRFIWFGNPSEDQGGWSYESVATAIILLDVT